MSDKVLLRTENLKQYFPVGRNIFGKPSKFVKAVDDVSLFINRGETLGLVGESGCGKTTFGKTVLHLIKPTGGKVIYDGTDLSQLKEEQLRRMRPKMQIVFQDPYGSLNERMSVGTMLQGPMVAHEKLTKEQVNERIQHLLQIVGLKPFHARRYPHEFSGGQRQRIAIAKALAVNPEFIVCDEPVSALDVSVQSQVLNLLNELKHNLGLTYLFISHDLSVVRHISDRIGVMYLGKLVELAGEKDLYENQMHPYTRALFSAMPIPKVGAKKERMILQGDLPSPINPPPGCPFHTRCPYATERCMKEVPQLHEATPGHFVSCHLFDK